MSETGRPFDVEENILGWAKAGYGLREQLARRLAEVSGVLTSDKVAGCAVVIESQSELFTRLADEVLRQMEWARQHGLIEHHREFEKKLDLPKGARMNVHYTPSQLTLAPPGWKP